MGEVARLYAPPVLAWLALAARMLTHWGRGHDDSKRLVLIFLAGAACTFTMQTPLGYDFTGELLGIPNIAKLLNHVCVLVTALTAQRLLLRLTDNQTAQRRAWWLIAVAAGMVIAFTVADTPVNDVTFNARYSATPWVLEYWLIYLTGLLPMLVDIARLGWRCLAVAEKRAVRLRMWMTTAGAVALIVYHLHKAFYFLAQRLGLPYPELLNQLLDRYLTLGAFLLVVMSAALPRSRTSAVRGWIHRYLTYHRLRPLWVVFYRANPKIALRPPRPALLDRLDPRDLDMRLYRRVVEIRDGRLAIQPYLRPHMVETARLQAAQDGKTGQELNAEVEARILAEGLRACASGAPRAEEPVVAAIPGGLDLDSDTAFLAEVARAFNSLATA
ncbi:MAG: MAB_1171c family putative transporter [Kibdelosporangium sp.]